MENNNPKLSEKIFTEKIGKKIISDIKKNNWIKFNCGKSVVNKKLFYSDKELNYYELPSKKCSLFSYQTLDVTNDNIIDLYLDINTEETKFKNFTETIKNRLTNNFKDEQTGIIINSSKKSNIIISSINTNVYFSVVNCFDCTLLIWSSIPEVITLLLEAIPDRHNLAYLKKEVWINHITPLSNTKNTCIIHPLYLLSRYRTWGYLYKFDKLILFNLLNNYLNRISI